MTTSLFDEVLNELNGIYKEVANTFNKKPCQYMQAWFDCRAFVGLASTVSKIARVFAKDFSKEILCRKVQKH